MNSTTRKEEPVASTAAKEREARQRAWRREHAAALEAQDDWMDEHGHPFASIMPGYGKTRDS